MQKIKHIICGLLAVAMLIGGAVSASAATRIQHTDNSLIGDVDNDNAVKINDATLLQKQLAEYSTELDVTNAYTHAVLDANQDNKITIGDVTEIQRYLADLPVAHVSKAIPSTTAIMHKKWMEENGVKPGDFYDDLTAWYQSKHMKSTLMKSPTTGKLCAVLTDCQGEMWGAGIGKPYERTKFSAYQDWVYIGGQEYTYPAIYKYIYTEKCACGDVKRVYAKQTAYPSREDIVAGTYTEKLVDVEP